MPRTTRLEDASRDADLIDRWLDEGDRLSEDARASAPGPAVQRRRRLAEALGDLRAMAERHRFSFVAGAVVLATIAVAGMRALSHAVLTAEQAVASEPPRAAPPPAAIAAPPPPAAAAPAPALAEALAAPGPAVTVEEPTPEAPEPRHREAASLATVAVAREAPPAAAEPAIAHDAPPVDKAAVVREPRDTMQACQTALRRERVKAALAACATAANDNPTAAGAQVLLAQADLLAGRDRETLRLARRALSLDPGTADAYLLIGSVQQAAGRRPDARNAYESYLHAAPHGLHAAEVRAILKTL